MIRYYVNPDDEQYIYTPERLFQEGYMPAQVIDANGMIVRRNIVQVNIKTGEVWSLAIGTDGKLLAERYEVYPAPLRFEKVTDSPLYYEEHQQ